MCSIELCCHVCLLDSSPTLKCMVSLWAHMQLLTLKKSDRWKLSWWTGTCFMKLAWWLIWCWRF